RARTREIATLRVLGFGSMSVAISVLLEAVLLALVGAALGTLAAWLAFDGRVVYSGTVFRFDVSVMLVALGLAWGVAIALLGGVFRQSGRRGSSPHRRCAQSKVVRAG